MFVIVCCVVFFVFFFKQKTAYEMRISDWSSDVCSSDLPEELGRLIDVIEAACGRKAVRDFQPMQPGDVVATAADITATTRDFGFRPTVGIEAGIPRFVDWYRHYTNRWSHKAVTPDLFRVLPCPKRPRWRMVGLRNRRGK